MIISSNSLSSHYNYPLSGRMKAKTETLWHKWRKSNPANM